MKEEKEIKIEKTMQHQMVKAKRQTPNVKYSRAHNRYIVYTNKLKYIENLL